MTNIMTFKAIKNMVCTIALILPIQIGTGILLPTIPSTTLDNVINASDEIPLASTSVVLLDLKKEYCGVSCTLEENKDTVEFFAKAFGIKVEDIKEDLSKRNSEDTIKDNNIGLLKDKKGNLKSFDSFEKGFIEYLYDFVNNNPKKVNNKYVPYNGSAKYVENLIKYYTSIYDNVDYLTAISIGASESGYYKVKYMLNYNNIYGGMSSKGLIKYKNIEMGVLSYIRLLSFNYYGKGLDTPEKIGKTYCPKKVNGKVVASPHWLSLIASAKKYYKNSYEEITASKLLEDKVTA